MANTEMIRTPMDPELKKEAEKIFSALGLSPTEAITLFYKAIPLFYELLASHHGLPPQPIPNEETREAIRQARAGEGLSTYGSVKELIAELDDA